MYELRPKGEQARITRESLMKEPMSTPTAPLSILQRRRNAEMDKKRDNLARALKELSAYAQAHDGKFYLFGSALDKKRFSLHSDVDLIPDFGGIDAEWKAWNAAEEILSRYGLQIDGLPKSGCSERFLSVVSENWKEL